MASSCLVFAGLSKSPLSLFARRLHEALRHSDGELRTVNSAIPCLMKSRFSSGVESAPAHVFGYVGRAALFHPIGKLLYGSAQGDLVLIQGIELYGDQRVARGKSAVRFDQ